MNSRLETRNQTEVVGTRSTASVILPRQNGTRWNASLPKRGERAGVRCFPLFLVILLLLLLSPPPAPAATFTTNALITAADSSFDGQDIVVSGATLTVDWRHYFNSLLLTNGAVLTHSPCTTTNTHKLDCPSPGMGGPRDNLLLALPAIESAKSRCP